MKRKSGKIGLVVSDDQLRAAQMVDGELIRSSVPLDENFKKSVRQLLSSAGFVGKQIAVGVEGQSVLVESLVLPAGTKSARQVCLDRLKGDPVFSQDKAVMQMTEESAAGGAKQGSLVIMAALESRRLEDIMDVCRDSQLDVETVECGALSAWRGWSGDGVQLRMIRSGGRDTILAGRDDRLLFARVVPAPIAANELKATVTRALAAVGAAKAEVVGVCGVPADECEVYGKAVGARFEEGQPGLDDAVATGLLNDSRMLLDFTPPQEKVMRQKRKVRKYGVTMSAACGLLVLMAGVTSLQTTGDLEQQREDLQNQLSILQLAKNELTTLEDELSREQANEKVISLAYPGHRMSTLFSIIADAAAGDITIETIKIDDTEVSETIKAGEGETPQIVTRRVLDIRISGLGGDNLAAREFNQRLLDTQAFSNAQVEASESILIGVGSEGQRFRIVARAETR